MYLQHISLKNFRNYLRLELDLPQGVTVVQGRNAQGKTNLLEAIAYLATGKSLRALTERELVHWLAFEQEPIPYAEVAGDVLRDGIITRLRIVLTQQGGRGSGSGLRKVVMINGVRQRTIDLLGILPIVLFLPEDISLVSGPPSARRKYLNLLLCQIDREYCSHLDAYTKVVTRRNAQLRAFQGKRPDPTLLAFWNDALVEHGTYIIHRRQEIIARLDELVREQHRILTAGHGRLRVEYRPSLTLIPPSTQVPKAQLALALAKEPVAYTPPPILPPHKIRKRFQETLNTLQREEIEAGATLVGPHRDEMAFLLDGRDVRTFGSRGQQRTVALAVKLAEVQLIEEALGTSPLLLLDDVMSELDEERRARVLHVVRQVPQAILTTTDWDVFDADFLAHAYCLQVNEGILTEKTPDTP